MAEYPFQMIGGVPVVTSPAEIDTTTTAGGLRAILLEWQSRGHTTVVVDLTGTQFCDSAGLRELVWAHKRAVANGGGLQLVMTPDSAVARIFTVTGLDPLIPHVATVKQALAQVPLAGPARCAKILRRNPPPARRVRQRATGNAGTWPGWLPIAAVVSIAVRCSRRCASTPGSAAVSAGPPGTVSTSAIRPWKPARSPGRWPR